jgi:hypothetical protein
MLNIIITKRNNTVIAPTYKIIYEIPMKPIPERIKNPAALKNTAIKKITEITGLTAIITKTLEKIVAHANKSIKKFVIIKNFT